MLKYLDRYWLLAYVLFVSAACGSEAKQTCTLFCERIVVCTEQVHPPEFNCEWADPDAMEDTCIPACVETMEKVSAAVCIECLSENFACATTGAMRPCDSRCEGTVLITGKDFEGANEYFYPTWFWDNYQDPSLWVCQ